MKPEAPPLRPHMIKSVLLHSLAVLLICGVLYKAHQSIEDQEQAFLEDLQAQEEALEEAEREATEELLKEELEAQLAEELEPLIEEELDLATAEALKEDLHEQLEVMIDEAAEEMPLQEMSAEDLSQLAEELRQMSMSELQKELEEMKKEMLLDMVREKIEKEVAPDIRRNIEKELKNQTGKKLKEQLERKAKENNKERVEELQKELTEAKKELQDLAKKQQDITNKVRQDKKEPATQTQEEVTEKLKEVSEKIADTLAKLEKTAPKQIDTKRITENMKKAQEQSQESTDTLKKEDSNKQQQQKESQDVSKQLSQAQKEIDNVNKQLSRQKNLRELSAIDRQAIEEVLSEVEQKVKEDVTKAITDESVPLAAQKLTKVLEKHLESLQLNNDSFRSTLEKEIREALDKDMTKNQTKSDTSTLRSKDMVKKRSSEDIAKARESIKKALDKLEKVNKEQETLKKETIRESAAKDAQAELEIREDIKDAQQDAKKALDEATAATLKMERSLDNAQRDINSDTALKKAKDASNYVKQEIVDEAKKSMQAVNDDLAKKMNKLKEMDKGLEQEQKALEQIEEVSADLKELLGEEGAEELKKELSEGADASVDATAKKDVKTATEKTKIDDSLEGIEALTAMQELSDTMGEMAEDGRMMDNAGELMGDMAEGLLGPGQGKMPPGASAGGGQRFWGNGRGYMRFNRELYEEFSKDMRERLNPKKAYEEQEEQEGLHSTAQKRVEEAAATMVVLKGQNSNTKDEGKEKDENRKVPEPTFTSIKFGAADYQIDPLTIDGDLRDWGELRHPHKHTLKGDGTTVDGPEVFMRWSPKGLYLCYKLKTTVPINNHGPHMWQTTGLELFVDVRNRRKDNMMKSPTSQQIFFCPFGFQKNPKVTFGESGRGFRGLKAGGSYPDLQSLRGKGAAKLVPGGYHVEMFMKRSSLAHPVLAPGMYLAINHSVNLGDKYETQWSAPKVVQTWNKPDTWGDVLLLGSDARVAFKDHERHEAKVQGVLPGSPVRVEITDPDMNLYDLKSDRIACTVNVEGTEAPVLLILKETKPNSGVFAGSFATQAYFMPAKANTLNIRGGNSIILTYTDARSGYGEKNRKVTASLAVGWPVTELSK